MRALCRELVRRGFFLEENFISTKTRACVFNSFNFDFDRLRQTARLDCRMIHRVDGPIAVYRGWDDGSDRRMRELNHDIADATIFQSRYSLEKHRELNLTFRSPVVIMNAADPAIFHCRGRIPFNPHRKTRLVSVSWSDNPNKGAAVYKWLEEHLDWERYDYTFVGRSQIAFDRIRCMPPVPSDQVADVLRRHDIYITASQHDPCSNSLIEALSCGLPAVYLASGGHPEIVGEAGVGFQDPDDIPAALDQVRAGYARYQQAISVPTIAEVAARYVAVMRVGRA